MFIVPAVPDYFPFMPQVRKEISEVEWFPIDDLPKHTYGVLPFISRVNKWIIKEQEKKEKNAIAISVEKAQQVKEGRGEVVRKSQQSSSKAVSVSKRKEKFVENKEAAPATSNGVTSSYVEQQQVTNRKEIIIKHDNGPNKRDQRTAIDQEGITMSSSAYNIGGCHSVVRSLREIEGETTTTPNCSGELFGEFRFDVADILARIK